MSILIQPSNGISKTLTVNIESVGRLPDLPFIEAQRAAQRLKETLPNISIALSGGLDSEVLLTSLLAADVPFRAFFWDYGNSINDQDFRSAEELCLAQNIDLNIIHFDMIDSIRSGAYQKLLLKHKVTNPLSAIQRELLEQTPGQTLFGGEIFRPLISNNAVYWYIDPIERSASSQVWQGKKYQVPYFSLATPELALSYLTLPLIYQKNVLEVGFEPSSRHGVQNLDVQDNYDTKETYQTKKDIYEAAGFPLRELPPRKEKLNGFEELRQHLCEKDDKDFFALLKNEPQAVFEDVSFRFHGSNIPLTQSLIDAATVLAAENLTREVAYA